MRSALAGLLLSFAVCAFATGIALLRLRNGGAVIGLAPRGAHAAHSTTPEEQ